MIDAEKANYPISRMCRLLKVDRRRYYEWRKRRSAGPTPRQQRLTRILFDRSGSAEDFELIRLRHVACMSDRFERIQIVLRHAVERRQLPADMDCRLGAMAVLLRWPFLISVTSSVGTSTWKM